MGIEAQKLPEKQKDIYSLTKKLKDVDLSNINEDFEIAKDKEKGFHSMEAALFNIIPDPGKLDKDADHEARKTYNEEQDKAHTERMAILARATYAGFNTDGVKAGDSFKFDNGLLLVDGSDKSKYAINLTNEEKVAPEGYKLLSKREDVKMKTRRAWESIDHIADSGILSRVLEVTGHKPRDWAERLSIWDKMKTTPNIIAILQNSHKQLKGIDENFFEEQYTGGDDLQQRAMIEFLRMSYHTEKPAIPKPAETPTVVNPTEKPKTPAPVVEKPKAPTPAPKPQPAPAVKPVEKPKNPTPTVAPTPTPSPEVTPVPVEKNKAMKELEKIGTVTKIDESKYSVVILGSTDPEEIGLPKGPKINKKYTCIVKVLPSGYQYTVELENGNKEQENVDKTSEIKEQILTAELLALNDIIGNANDITSDLKALGYKVNGNPITDRHLTFSKNWMKGVDTIGITTVSVDLKKKIGEEKKREYNAEIKNVKPDGRELWKDSLKKPTFGNLRRDLRKEVQEINETKFQ